MTSKLEAAGDRAADGQAIKAELGHFTKLPGEACLASGDFIDLKAFEPAMQFLIDAYIHAEKSEKISAFDNPFPEPATFSRLAVHPGVAEARP